jgi:hypothetical protein
MAEQWLGRVDADGEFSHRICFAKKRL